MFAGMEVAGYHADQARRPGRDFPRAILLAAVVMTAFTILGSLALAVVVPQHEISLVGGVMQAFQAVFDALEWSGCWCRRRCSSRSAGSRT